MPISQLTKYVAALLISWVVLSINAFASPRLVIDESFEREIINHYARVSIAPNSATYFDVLTGSPQKHQQQRLLQQNVCGIQQSLFTLAIVPFP